jgi:norsolorinic acid ketoreductase
VIAAVRDPANASSQSLKKLPVASGTSLVIVPLEGDSDKSALEAVEILKTKYSITSLDVVIANAGIAEFYGKALQTPLAGTRQHFNVNAVGTLALFQAIYPLLEATERAGSTPKFVTVTSTVGSIGEMEKIPMISTAYGASKAALNYITKKIALEYPGIISFPINPG